MQNHIEFEPVKSVKTASKISMQATLSKSVSFTGIGLHTGCLVNMTVHPQPSDIGVWFARTDIHNSAHIAALYDSVPASKLCTKLVGADGTEVSTVEHLMAALAGCGIHNALVEVDGPELPILDGSAEPFVREFLAAGIQHQTTPIRMIKILKEVSVTEGAAHATLSPANALEMDFTIDFADSSIGHQHLVETLSNEVFMRKLCDSRTFCRKSDVDAMHNAGLALGGTYDNAVVVDGETVLNPGGLRHTDEAVRHKMLDALGDLALAGAPILGRYTGFRSGHMLTNQLLRKLFATQGAWRFVYCASECNS